MTAIKKDIEKYISEVGTHLFCLKKNKKTVLEDIREAVFEFTENNDVTSMDVIYERFGTPEEIAKAYIADAEPKNIKKAISVRKVLVWAVVAVVLAFVIFLLSLFTFICVVFLFAIIIGYISGITGKIVTNSIGFSFPFYILNLIVVSTENSFNFAISLCSHGRTLIDRVNKCCL